MAIDIGLYCITTALKYAPEAYFGYTLLNSNGSLSTAISTLFSTQISLAHSMYEHGSLLYSPISPDELYANCIKKVEETQLKRNSYSVLDFIFAKPAVDLAFAKKDEALCGLEYHNFKFATDYNIVKGYHIGAIFCAAVATAHIAEKQYALAKMALKTSKMILKTSKMIYHYSSQFLGASVKGCKSIMGFLQSFRESSSSNEVKITNQDQEEIFSLLKKLSSSTSLSPNKVFHYNNKVNVRFQVELPLDEFAQIAKAAGVIPSAILKDENGKAVLVELVSKNNYRVQVVSR
jgi:hypothetical protein